MRGNPRMQRTGGSSILSLASLPAPAAQRPQRYPPMKHLASTHVFDLANTGLVIVKHEGKPEHFTIVRPASLTGTQFLDDAYVLGVGTATLLSDAPVASLRQLVEGGEEWEVDISMAAAPGPGPVWIRGRFPNLREAVEAIRECYFADRVDFSSEALSAHHRRARAASRSPSRSELPSEKAVRIARGILEGSTPVFLGCKHLAGPLARLGVGREEPFITITGVESELDEAPISPEERKHWNPQALAREDAKLAAWLPKIEPAVFEACRAVLRQFAKRG
jgi:hypothetical protein